MNQSIDYLIDELFESSKTLKGEFLNKVINQLQSYKD